MKALEQYFSTVLFVFFVFANGIFHKISIEVTDGKSRVGVGVNNLKWAPRKLLVFAHLRTLPVICNRKWAIHSHIKTFLFPSSAVRPAPNALAVKSIQTTK